ncbi:hypothetical protein J6590_002035 [Homalodisca vitripennis]|nr:hypothetical protein J6590_002035 [Homalodisca vitripennis]
MSTEQSALFIHSNSECHIINNQYVPISWRLSTDKGAFLGPIKGAKLYMPHRRRRDGPITWCRRVRPGDLRPRIRGLGSSRHHIGTLLPCRNCEL